MPNYDYLCPVGRVYISPYQQPNLLHELGETSDFKITVDSETKELANHRTEARGIEAMLTRTKSVKVSLTIHDFNYDNALFLLNGMGKKLPAGAATEIFEVANDHPIMLSSLIGAGATISVKSLDESVTYTLGSDFNLVNNVIIPKSITGKIKVTYDSVDSSKIAALLLRSAEYKLYFDGINEYNGKSIKLDFHRVRFTPSKDIAIITEDFNKFSIEGVVLREPNDFDPLNPESEFFNIIQEN